MRILVDSDSSACLNLGDLAMLQVAARRLRAQWPDSCIQVITEAPQDLPRFCADTLPVPYMSRYSWLGDVYLLGGVHYHLPKPVSRQLGAMKRTLGRSVPALVGSAIRLKAGLRHLEGDPQPFLDAVHRADVVVVSGLGGITDSARVHARLVLGTLDMAQRRGIPTLMFSQGIGPLTDPELLAMSKAILPRVNLIALREGKTGIALLKALGVPADRIQVTGDDAIELAYEARAATLGDGIGLNLRVTPYAGVGQELIGELRSVLHQFAGARRAPLYGIPIALHKGAQDQRTIRELLDGYGGGKVLQDPDLVIDTPEKAITQANRCRIVVAGAYHAAVFALSQGIPTVCLASSRYYVDKFVGLADLFGTGCEIVFLDQSDWPDQLVHAMTRVWDSAEQVRPSLLQSAARQIELSKTAYGQAFKMIAQQSSHGLYRLSV